jgi:hypothetical protein
VSTEHRPYLAAGDAAEQPLTAAELAAGAADVAALNAEFPDEPQDPTGAPAPMLSDGERSFLAYALDLADDAMASEDGFTDDDRAALASLRKLAGGES